MELNETKKKKLLAHLDVLFKRLDELLYDTSLVEWKYDRYNGLYCARAILMDPHLPQELVKDLAFCHKRLSTLIPLARGLGSMISKFDLEEMDENLALIAMFWREPICLDDPRLIFTRWYQNYFQPSQRYYPRTGQHGYVDYLVAYLEQVKAKAGDSIGPLKFYISRLQRMLQLVSSHLVGMEQRRKEDAYIKNLMEETANLAYTTEYAIDLFLVREIPIWYSLFWLQDIHQELIDKIGQWNIESGDTKLIIDEILSQLYSRKHKIIALLKNIEIDAKFNKISKVVAVKFDICTWSSVSSYKKRKKEVFLELLRNVSASKSRIDKIEYTSDMSEVKLKEKIYKLLNNKSYFIILKDVDDIDNLDEIRRLFPIYGFRYSRILLTTRSPELVAYCRSGCQKDLIITKISDDHTSTSQHSKPTIDDDVLGFETETENMLGRLTREPKQLRIISIVGMAGQGKTTLAKKLYNDLSVVNYFDTRAWVCVSQVYLKRDLLLELLGQVVQLSDTIRLTNDEDLASMLWKSLAGLRFLVVLDDLWSSEAWDDLKRCFPDQNNGSRIIFTTRQERLASKAQSRSMLQHLNPLSEEESWALLQNKLFGRESCPRELSEAGKEIAKYCKGLPLSIVLTAGLLKKMEMREDVWNDIADNLSSRIFNDAKAEDKGVIELSYKHLPDHLRPCFLYFGAFLEDREVPVKKLLRMWIAEGFIRDSDLKCLEDVAEDYLLDLIGRSLVIVAQEKSNGGVKSCRVHDLLREFALTKAREENFLEVIEGYNEQFDLHSEPITFYRSRLCIYSNSNRFFNLRVEPHGPLVRSLLFFDASDMSPGYSYDISFIFRNFKLLRILKFEDINIGDSFTTIDVLLHLRYLAVQGTMVSVPSSISNLWNLETFSVKSLEDNVVKVPDSIWNLARLRHLHIHGNASFELDTDRLENSFVQDDLQTLSTPSLAYGDDMEKILRKLRGIRKLKCIFLDSWDDARNCNQFPVLGFLSKLESLKVFYNGENRFPCQFNFPSNLKKLTLTNFGMPWSEISQLASLDNLEVLKLLGNAFEGERWEMGDEVVFPKLKFLKLDSLNVVEWHVTGDHFPRLEHLFLHKCEQLEEIPPSIGDIPTLQMIKVIWCNPSAAISARNIQEEQLDFGNEGFKIHVHPKVWDLSHGDGEA